MQTNSTRPGRVRIAVASPDILAHIRNEFTSRGLDVRIDGPPVVDVTISAGAGIPGPDALAAALNALAPPRAQHRDPATARYRMMLVPRDRSAPSCGVRRWPDGPVPDHPPLSARESQVMDSISRGLRNADIAALLKVRQKTVKNYANRIFTKLGARSRVEAVLIWQRSRTHPCGEAGHPSAG